MKKTHKKVWYKRKWVYVVGGILLVVGMYFGIQGIRCKKAVKQGKERLQSYQAKTIGLSYGNMTYVDHGKGKVILSVHGIFGGYDQAYDTCRDFSSDYRIIAPSRFGYLGSDVMGDGTPAEQAKAYVEMMDRLGIEKVYLLATSAGGSVAIRFALDYPERTSGLILYCSAMPYAKKPEKYMDYAGPPSFLCNDYAMFLISPLFEPIMGMNPDTIYGMLPISERKEGVVLDASITNPDMARNFDDYPIRDMKVPSLILQAKDDKLVSYSDTVQAVPLFPNCTFVEFEKGGHLMEGHGNEIRKRVNQFISETD